MRRFFKKKTLRYPGQSLDRKWDCVVEAFMLKFLVFIVFFLYVFILWLTLEMNQEDRAFVMRAFLVISALYLFYLIPAGFFAAKKARDLRLGRDAERIVGAQLNELIRKKGVRVLHDMPCDGFNINHVVISQNGVYVINTKALANPKTKPKDGNAELYFDGEKVLLFGKPFKKNPVAQVAASAQWLSNIIERVIRRKIYIQPVVVFPEWYVEGKNDRHMWVLNEKALAKFIEYDLNREILPLTNEGVEQIAWILIAHIQTRLQEESPSYRRVRSTAA